MNQRVGRILIIVAAISGAVGNIITAITGDHSFVTSVLYTAPPIIGGIGFLVAKHIKGPWLATFFMLCAWIAAGMGEQGNPASAFFVIFSFHAHKSDIRLIVMLAGVAIVTMGKFVFLDYGVSQFFAYNSGYIFFLGYYWYRVYREGPGGFAPIEGHPIDEINLRILHLLAEGKTRQEIADRVFLSYSAVTQRVQRLREAMEFETVEVMMYRLTVAGVIPSSLPEGPDQSGPDDGPPQADEGMSEKGNMRPNGDMDAQL